MSQPAFDPEVLKQLKRLQSSGWEDLAWMGGKIIAIWVVAWLLVKLQQLVRRKLQERYARRISDLEQVKRADALSRLVGYILTLLVFFFALTSILSVIGLSLAPLLGAAGVAGVALGFAAQGLMKDYITGVGLLLSNQIRRGDVVKVAGLSGAVEDITLRYVRLRDHEGNVHFIPSNLISIVTNMSRGHAFAVVDVRVAWTTDTERATGLMRAVGKELLADDIYGPKILDEIEIMGVEKWEDGALTLRCRLKVLPVEQWAVRRGFLRRLAKVFYENGLEMPSAPAAAAPPVKPA